MDALRFLASSFTNVVDFGVKLWRAINGSLVTNVRMEENLIVKGVLCTNKQKRMWNPEESHNWGHCTKICFHFFKVFKNSKQKFWERILLVICAVGLRAILLFNTFLILSSIHWHCVHFKNLVASDLFCREWIHGYPRMMYCLRPVTVQGKVTDRLSEGIAQLRIYFRVTVMWILFLLHNQKNF